MKLQDYLNQHQVSFEVVPHPDTFDAQHLAQAVHVPGRNVAKGVLLRVNQPYRYVLAVLPATHRVDLDELSKDIRRSERSIGHGDGDFRSLPGLRIRSNSPGRIAVRDRDARRSSADRR